MKLRGERRGQQVGRNPILITWLLMTRYNKGYHSQFVAMFSMRFVHVSDNARAICIRILKLYNIIYADICKN